MRVVCCLLCLVRRWIWTVDYPHGSFASHAHESLSPGSPSWETRWPCLASRLPTRMKCLLTSALTFFPSSYPFSC
ncbi:hypothetical protein JOM56_007583, partial [Amanita muscaria]